MDRLVPDKKKRPIHGRGSTGFTGESRNLHAHDTTPASYCLLFSWVDLALLSLGAARTGGSGAIAKARAETQRARVAMTHASGKFILPPDRARGSKARSESAAFVNPYLQSQQLQQAQPYASLARGPSRPISSGPRLPAPRLRLPIRPSTAFTPDKRTSSSPAKIQGAYPTSEQHTRRAALPAHLESHIHSRTPAQSSPEQAERFRIPEHRRKAFQTVHKPAIGNFAPPTGKSKGIIVDFFGDGHLGATGTKATHAPSGFLESLQRSQNPDQPVGKREPEVGQKRSVSAMAMGGTTGSKGKEVESVLFRQKKKRTGAGVQSR
jgi:hypothetical protein